MFDNPGFGYAGLAMQIGGALTSAMGSFYAAKGQKSALEAQAHLADTNARIAEMGAQSALLAGEKEVGRVTLRAGQVKSAQRTAMAANGVDLGEGNAAEIQATTDLMKEIDVNQIQANAVRSAWGYRMQGVNYQNEAIIKRGTAGGLSPGTAAFSSLLGSASNVAGSWYMMNKAGMFDGGKAVAADVTDANRYADPIGALGSSRGWF